MVRRALLLALLFLSCKDDPTQPAICSGPDFDVLITTGEGPLPADTVATIEYAGGGPEQYSYPDPNPNHQALFCAPSDREGNPLPMTGGSGGGAAAGLGGGQGGEGGEGPSGDIEAWRCSLWTYGPATLTVESSIYPSVEERLAAKKGKCTVMAEIVIGPADGGM